MTDQPRYIHVRNWDRFQRFKDRKPSWVRLHFDLLRNDDYLQLSAHRRAVLHGLWIEYGLNMRKDADDRFTVRRGLRDDTATLSRRLALRVTTPDLETLNHAGFTFFSEHETVTWSAGSGALDTQILRNLDNTPALTRKKQETATRKPHTTDKQERPHDLVWDTLEQLFGKVAGRTNAHAKRNKAVADLKRHEATPELILDAHKRWPRLFANATVTDLALATHYPQLAPTEKPKGWRPPCAECGMGGGLHVADCSKREELTEAEASSGENPGHGDDVETSPASASVSSPDVDCLICRLLLKRGLERCVDHRRRVA